MVAVTNLLSKYTILYGKVMTLVGTIQSVARRWTTMCDNVCVYMCICVSVYLDCVVHACYNRLIDRVGV